jgi:outer membrane cobalamin receptor
VAVRPFGASAIELHVRNLLDADYQMAYGFPAQGRVLLVGLRIGSE